MANFLLPRLDSVSDAEVAVCSNPIFPVLGAVMGGSIADFDFNGCMHADLFASLILPHLLDDYQTLSACSRVSRAWCHVVMAFADPRLLVMELLRARCCLDRIKNADAAAFVDAAEGVILEELASDARRWPTNLGRAAHLAALLVQLEPPEWKDDANARTRFASCLPEFLRATTNDFFLLPSAPAGLTADGRLAAARFGVRRLVLCLRKPWGTVVRTFNRIVEMNGVCSVDRRFSMHIEEMLLDAAIAFKSGYRVETFYGAGRLTITLDAETRQGGVLSFDVSEDEDGPKRLIANGPADGAQMWAPFLLKYGSSIELAGKRHVADRERSRALICGPNPMFADTVRFSPGHLIVEAAQSRRAVPARAGAMMTGNHCVLLHPVHFETFDEMCRAETLAFICPLYLLLDVLASAAKTPVSVLLRAIYTTREIMMPRRSADMKPLGVLGLLEGLLNHRPLAERLEIARSLAGDPLLMLADAFVGERSHYTEIEKFLGLFGMSIDAVNAIYGVLPDFHVMDPTIGVALANKQQRAALALLGRLGYWDRGTRFGATRDLHEMALDSGLYWFCHRLLEDRFYQPSWSKPLIMRAEPEGAEDAAAMVELARTGFYTFGSPKKRKRGSD